MKPSPDPTDRLTLEIDLQDSAVYSDRQWRTVATGTLTGCGLEDYRSRIGIDHVAVRARLIVGCGACEANGQIAKRVKFHRRLIRSFVPCKVCNGDPYLTIAEGVYTERVDLAGG